ncbi:hypothetical protein HDV00_010429 [Rhizophlyctis rosea]|nr:hypothetical protein HDV00_010429 [Rhizophlyctis rosea]
MSAQYQYPQQLGPTQPSPPYSSTSNEEWQQWLTTHANWPPHMKLKDVEIVQKDHQWTDEDMFREAKTVPGFKATNVQLSVTTTTPHKTLTTTTVTTEVKSLKPKKRIQKRFVKRKVERDAAGKFVKSSKTKSTTTKLTPPTPPTAPITSPTYTGPPNFHTRYLFHGTFEHNIPSILRTGYHIGPSGGIYLAAHPTTSVSYCRGGKKMLLNSVLLVENADVCAGGVAIMQRTQRVAPVAVLEFEHTVNYY